MPESLCRLTVQRGGDEAPSAVDLAVPSTVHLGQLMPSIVDMIHRDTGALVVGRRWRLSRIGGPALDESMTLRENGIQDGEFLLLTATDPPPPIWVPGDPTHIVAQMGNTHGGPTLRVLSVLGCLTMGGIGAGALVWPAVVTGVAARTVTGAGLAAAAAVGAVVARRAHPDALLCVTFSVIAVIFTAVVGFLAVPAGPTAAHVLLASTAAFSGTMLLIRLLGCGTVCLAAIATVSALTSAVAAACAAWQLPNGAPGASLATLSLATLAVAPRLSIAIAGIRPSPPSADDSAEPASDVDQARAGRAHQTLTGLVVGSSGAAALGAALVALSGFRNRESLVGVEVLIAVIALVLVLRSRTHVDVTRRAALCAGGMISASAGFAVGMASLPGQAHWISLLAAVGGVGAMSPFLGLPVGPFARRAVELIEYLALAAVVPLACWVGGLFGLARGMGLM